MVTYKARKASWFVVSGVREGEVFYRKTYHVGDKFMNWEMTYPDAQKWVWHLIVTRINAGFKPGT